MKMTQHDIIKIKKNGKIDIPSELAHEIGVVEGSYFLIEVSPEVKEARLERIALPGKELVEIELVVKDEPGVLSAISGIFARNNVNILFNESEEISSKKAVLILVIDKSKMDVSLDKLSNTLSNSDEVLDILVKDIH